MKKLFREVILISTSSGLKDIEKILNATSGHYLLPPPCDGAGPRKQCDVVVVIIVLLFLLL